MEKKIHGYSFGMYWHSNPLWYKINEELDRYELTEEAPDKAKRSFELYKKVNGLNY